MQPTPPEARPLAPGDVIAGKFRLERIIGRGGMGAVWAGRHVQLDMLVAVKFIEADPSPGADPRDARLRFEREAKAAAQIRSPHVAQIIDHGIDTSAGVDRPYIAMELLDGEDLGERLRRERRLSLPTMARILSQAAKALRRAHESGIIHRDLKPGNVFLARFDDDEVVKVLDFGVAKMRRAGAIDESPATQTGVVFGSPTYMSPEQARGVRDLDHRTDLWSLAVIVFRAVTGVKPFQGASIADIVIKLCIDPLPIATRFAPDLPPAIDRFFERAFARDPDKRFSSATEMAAAFEAVAAGAPDSVAPMPPHVLGVPAAFGTTLTPSGPLPYVAPAAARAQPAPPPVASAPLPPAAPVWGPDARETGTAVLSASGLMAAPHGATGPLPALAAPLPAQPALTPSGGVPVPAAPLVLQGLPAPTGAHPAPILDGTGRTGAHALPALPGSGPHVAFAPGTLTPPPRAAGEPTQPTPTTGTAALPSGGWGIAPAALLAAPPSAASPAPNAPPPGTGPSGAPRTTPVSPPRPVIFAVLGGAAVLGVLLVLLLVRRGPPAAPPAPAAAPPAPPSAIAPPAPTPSPVLPTTTAPIEHAQAAPQPTASASAPVPAEPDEPNEEAGGGDAGAASAAPASAGAPAPTKAGGRTGRKKHPNFGY